MSGRKVITNSGSPTSFASHSQSSGILKNNLETRKPSNTVKFSHKNEIRIIEGKDRKKKFSSPADQSRKILSNINNNIRGKSLESESEGYHSDCSSPRSSINSATRKSSLERRRKYGTGRKVHANRKSSGKISNLVGSDALQYSDKTNKKENETGESLGKPFLR